MTSTETVRAYVCVWIDTKCGHNRMTSQMQNIFKEIGYWLTIECANLQIEL